MAVELQELIAALAGYQPAQATQMMGPAPAPPMLMNPAQGGGASMSMGGSQAPQAPQMPQIAQPANNPMQQAQPPGYAGSQMQGPPDPNQAYDPTQATGDGQALIQQYLEAKQMYEKYASPRNPIDEIRRGKMLPQAEERLAQAAHNIESYNAEQAKIKEDAAGRKRAQTALQAATYMGMNPQQAMMMADAAYNSEDSFNEFMKGVDDRAAVISERKFEQSEELKTEVGRFRAYESYGIPEQVARAMAENEDTSIEEGVKLYYQRQKEDRELTDQKWEAQKFQAQELDKMDNAIRQVNRSIDAVSPWSAGFMSMTSVVPGTPAYDLITLLDTQQATIAFRELKAMREASKTGGALGNVSNREIELLYSSFAGLKAGMSPKQLRTSLSDILSNFESVRWSLDNEAKYQSMVESGDMTVEQATKQMTADRNAYVNKAMASRANTPEQAMQLLYENPDKINDFEEKFGWRPRL